MGRAWIGLLLVTAIATAACVGSASGDGDSNTQNIIGMGTMPDELLPMTAESVTTLGAYAMPIALEDGKPVLAPGAIVYAPRWELWTDGAMKRRFVVLPEGKKIQVDAATGAMEFPEGTHIFKEFYAEGRLVETRVLEKGPTGFLASTFIWSEDGTDALRDTDGKTVTVGTTDHVVPAQYECASCHNDGKAPVLGLSSVQLDPDMLPETTAALFETAPTPFKWGADIEPSVQATLGYVHANCGHCHREADDYAFFQLQFADHDQPAASIKSFNSVTENGQMMLMRIEANSMPPLGVTVVDPSATTGEIAEGIKKMSGSY